MLDLCNFRVVGIVYVVKKLDSRYGQLQRYFDVEDIDDESRKTAYTRQWSGLTCLPRYHQSKEY
jgi:hypothetical protein